MKKIFRNYTAEKPIRSVIYERPGTPIYYDKKRLFSRGVKYTREHIDELKKEIKESDNEKSSLKSEIKKRLLIKKKS